MAIVAQSVWAGRSFAARIAALAGRVSRRRMIVGWALGLYLSYGLTALLALLVLDRVGDVVDMPLELILTAYSLGLPAWIDGRALAVLTAELATGVLLGVLILWWRRRRGMPSFAIRHRSPAAMQTTDELPAIVLLSLSAGVSEELFFRLLLPLLVAIVTGSGVAGVAVGLAAFVAGHRYQGVAGMIAVTLVGAMLTALYLATGRLWVAMALHTLIDVIALIVRPALMRRATP